MDWRIYCSLLPFTQSGWMELLNLQIYELEIRSGEDMLQLYITQHIHKKKIILT